MIQQQTVPIWQRPLPMWLNLILFAALAGWGVTQTALANGRQATQSTVTNTVNTGYELPYHGFLTDASGNPLDGNHTIRTEICDTFVGGSCSVIETHNGVPVNNGVFSVVLGSQTAGKIPAAVFDNPPVYLQTTINGQTLNPRELIVAPPERQWRLLGVKTADNEIRTLETVSGGWHAVKGSDASDILELTATTQGGPVKVDMTIRYDTLLPTAKWCAVQIYDNNDDLIDEIHLDGVIDDDRNIEDLGCSSGYIVEDLPAGTYTFRAVGWVNETSTIEWKHYRQIAVSEYR